LKASAELGLAGEKIKNRTWIKKNDHVEIHRFARCPFIKNERTYKVLVAYFGRNNNFCYQIIVQIPVQMIIAMLVGFVYSYTWCSW
jgi:hypothetical protein